MEKTGKILLVFFVIMLMIPLFSKSSITQETTVTEESERVYEAIRVIEEIVDLPEEGLPEALLRNAHGIAVLPGVIKAAYGIGGQYGKGVILVQDEKTGWSNPTFVKIAGGSIGWQIGVQKSDIVLVFKTRKSIDNIAAGKVTLGADAGVAAGPVGRGAEASTDLEMDAEIYSYAKSRGLFAGVSLKGSVLQIDQEANQRFYRDTDITAHQIFSKPRLRVPEAAEKLKEILARYTRLK